MAKKCNLKMLEIEAYTISETAKKLVKLLKNPLSIRKSYKVLEEKRSYN